MLIGGLQGTIGVLLAARLGFIAVGENEHYRVMAESNRVNLSLGLGYVHNPDGVTRDWIEGGSWEVELAWKRYPAKVQFQSFYDPRGERIKA